jgi:hypothetical protein
MWGIKTVQDFLLIPNLSRQVEKFQVEKVRMSEYVSARRLFGKSFRQ